MPPFTVERNRIDYTSGTFDFVSTTIKFRPNVMAAADYICTLHEDAIEILLVSTPPTSTTGKIYNHSGKIKWNGEGLAYDSEVVHNNAIGEINALDNKAIPVAADVLLIEDSETTYSKKNILLSDLPGGSGTDDDAIHDNVASEISAVTLKATPVSADMLLVEDSADSNNKKRITVGSLPTGSDADAIHDNVAAEINAIAEKAVPISADLLVIEDSADSNNKKKVQVGNLPGDADAIHDNVASEISAVTLKATPVSADMFLIEDSADTNNKKRVTVGSLPTGSDADAIHDNVASEISAVALKATPVSGDFLLIEDSADTNSKKRVTIGTLPTGSDSDAIHDNVAAEISVITEKATPISADLLVIEDSADSNNKKRVQIGNLPGGSGTDADAIHDNVSAEINAITEKEVPVDADLLLIEDSESSNAKKRVQIGNLPGAIGGGTNVLFEKTIASATNNITIPGLSGVTRATMYLDHINGSASSAAVKIYVDGDTVADDADYDAIYVYSSGTVSGGSSAYPLVCNTRGNKRSQVRLDLAVIDGIFWARAQITLESTGGLPEVVERSINKNVGTVTDLSGMSLGAITNGFGVGTKVVIIDPIAANSSSNVLFREVVTAEKQTINIGNLAGKQSARIYLKHKAGGTGDKNVRIYVNGDTDNGDYEGVTWGAGYSSAVIASPSISNCVSGATNTVTVDVEINNGVVYMTGYERRRSEASQAFLIRHIFYDTEVVTDLSQLQLVAVDSDGFGVGTEVVVTDPFAAVTNERKVAIFEDQKTAGTESGGATAGSYEIRDLNTTVSAAPGITLDGSNQITLTKGYKYHVRWEVPAYRVGKCKSRLYNVTNAVTEHVGASGYSNSTTLNAHGYCNGDCVVDLTAASTDEVFTVQHRVQLTYAVNGHGVAANLGEPEVYARVVVERL